MKSSKSRLRRFAAGAMLVAGFYATGVAPPVHAQEAGPRLGTYKIVLVQLTSGTVSSLLVLKDGGVYEVHDMPGQSLRSRGNYRYDSAQRRVIWLSGLNYEMGRGGTFKVEQGGRVHRIQLGSKAYAISGE